MLDRSSVTVKVLKVFKELILLLKDCDILCFLLLRMLETMDDGVGRLLQRNSWAEEKRGFLWNLKDALHVPVTDRPYPLLARSCR